METPPAAPGGGAETLGAAAEAQAIVAAKRERKRSRYLSGDYDTAILDADDDDDDIAASPTKGEDAAALLLRLQEASLAAADLLAALLRSAASPCDDCVSPGPGVVDAGVLRSFFALHRASFLATKCEDTSTTTDHQHSKDAAAAAGHGHGLPNPCGAMAVAVDGSAGEKQDDAIAMGHAYAAAHIGPANAAAAQEAGPKKRNKVTFALDGCTAAADCSAQPAASSAMGHASYGQHTGPANAPAAAPEAGPKRRRRRKKVTSALHTPNAATPAGCSAQQPGTGTGANSAPPKKKARNGPGHGRQQSGKPVALVLEFSQERSVCPPSKEALLSTFRGFGSLNEPETEITTRRARFVFQSSAAAEAAYSCAHTLGTFSARRLQYLRPPPPAPKIPLADVRKNLEKMIASLTAPSVLGRDGALDLAGQMLHLMAKVDKTLTAAGAPGPSAVHRH